MCVFADIERTGDALGSAVLDDGLRRRGDVRIIERRIQAGPAMSGSAENHLLVGIAGVRDEVVIRADDCVDVDEIFRKSRLAGARVSHGPHSAVVSPGQQWAREHVLTICRDRQWLDRFAPLPERIALVNPPHTARSFFCSLGWRFGPAAFLSPQRPSAYARSVVQDSGAPACLSPAEARSGVLGLGRHSGDR